MNSNEALAALTAAGLARLANDLTPLLRDSIRLTASAADESALPVGASKLGGQPDLPQGTAWPQLKGQPMSFVAQIRLADAHPYGATSALPASGLLSFFYDSQQQTFGADPADRGGWQVLYYADTTSLQRSSAPPNLANEARFTACALAFSSEATLPQDPKLEQPNLSWSQDDVTQYENFLATFPSQADRATPHNRMLGYSDTIQDDMRLECQLSANGVSAANAASDPRTAELTKGARNWLLLLQIDSDPAAGMHWADAGMLYYWIEQDALKAQKFDNVWVVLQSD